MGPVQEEAAARQALVAMRAELGQERAANEQRWTGLQAAQDCMVDLKVHFAPACSHPTQAVPDYSCNETHRVCAHTD